MIERDMDCFGDGIGDLHLRQLVFMGFDEFWLFRDKSRQLNDSLRMFRVFGMGDEALGLLHGLEEVAAFLGLVVAGEGQGHDCQPP